MAEAPEVKYRVSGITYAFMVAFAVVCDGIQIILTLTGLLILVADLVTFMAGVGYWLWFKILGVKYASGKKARTKIITAASSIVVEAVPLLSALPMLTVGVVSMANASRAEDREAANANIGEPQQQAAA